jgi:octaprenyl-diphosphate synthase
MEKQDQEFLDKHLSGSRSLQALYQGIQLDMDKVEAELKVFTESPNKIISEISDYLFQRSGKRIRPALLMLCSKLFDYRGEEHIQLSALVETIHTASLLHDDIIDNSDLRRGQDTVHTRWGPNITVLLGDYLYIKTIGLSLFSSNKEFIKILTDVSARMIEGELQEYYITGNLDLAEEEYLDIIDKKTAALFSASCHLGALLGKASPSQQQALIDYGTCIGMAFQIIDDLLDYSGNTNTLGKPVLSDICEGRITLPLIYTLKNDGVHNRDRMAELYRTQDLEEAAKDEILEIIRSNGALDYTFQKAREFTQKAQELLQTLPDSVYRDSLSLLPEFILTRNK